MLQGSVTASLVRQLLDEQFLAWELGRSGSKPMFMVTDKGSNVARAVKDIHYLVWVGCMAHIFHRAVL